MWAAELGIRVGRLGSRRETERLDEQQWGANPALRCSTNNALENWLWREAWSTKLSVSLRIIFVRTLRDFQRILTKFRGIKKS